MSGLVGNTLQGDAAMMMANTPTPAIKKGAHYTPEQARKVAEEYEGVFLSQMMKPMFEGIETDGVFGGGQAEKMFRSLQIDEYGKSLARSGGVGIADEVMRQMLQAQEVGPTPPLPASKPQAAR